MSHMMSRPVEVIHLGGEIGTVTGRVSFRSVALVGGVRREVAQFSLNGDTYDLYRGENGAWYNRGINHEERQAGESARPAVQEETPARYRTASLYRPIKSDPTTGCPMR